MITYDPPTHSLDSAGLTAVDIQVSNEEIEGFITPRLLLLGVSAVTDARRPTQLLEVHGVLEGGIPSRVQRIRVFER